MPSSWPPDHAAAFATGIARGALPPGVTARDPAEADRRFAVYRNNVAHGLSEALARRFPVVRRLVGDDFFRAMSRAFVAAHPPASPVLLAWGEALPDFLAGFQPVAGLPYLPDVARLEIARGRAFHAGDAPELGAEGIARLAAPNAAPPRLHPSVQVVPSRFAVVSIWRANQPGRRSASASLTVGQSETALVLRDRSLDVAVHGIGRGDRCFLEALLGRAALLSCAAIARQAEPGHAPSRLLSLLAGAGAFVEDLP